MMARILGSIESVFIMMNRLPPPIVVQAVGQKQKLYFQRGDALGNGGVKKNSGQRWGSVWFLEHGDQKVENSDEAGRNS
jgi:hypothetical protein